MLKRIRQHPKESAIAITVVAFIVALLVVPGCGTIEGLAKDMADMSRATRNAMQN